MLQKVDKYGDLAYTVYGSLITYYINQRWGNRRLLPNTCVSAPEP